ncbi:MAG: endonuclease domain-containing protein, partial [Caulobacteraceae bacterium]
ASRRRPGEMMERAGAKSPFPLDGGRAGDGGDGPAATTRPVRRSLRDISAPEWAPKKAHGAYAIPRARRLRQAMTVDEDRLWQALRKLKVNIRRQAPMGPYVVDFVCHAGKLVIEVDGYYHSLPERQEKDAERDAWLNRQGYRVLRLSTAEVQGNLATVCDRIEFELSPPSPALPPSRGKGEV